MLTPIAREAALAEPLERTPAAGARQRHRPVDEIEVDVIEAQPLEAPRELARRVRSKRHPFCRDEHLVPREGAVSERNADAALVPVGRRGVDVAIPGLERPLNGLFSIVALTNFPDPEAQHGHEDPVPEIPHGVSRRVRAGWVHGAHPRTERQQARGIERTGTRGAFASPRPDTPRNGPWAGPGGVALAILRPSHQWAGDARRRRPVHTSWKFV